MAKYNHFGETQVINNQITGSTISLGDTSLNIPIKGTTVSKSKHGLIMVPLQKISE